MPKRPRQAHIPRQTTRKRKGRRDGVTTPADAYLNVSGAVSVPGYTFGEPVAPAPIPAPARRTRGPASASAPRAGTARAASQLPVFERAYLVEELRRIGLISGSLLGAIIVLTIFLR